MRGGDPYISPWALFPSWSFPHARGWSPPFSRICTIFLVFPACAGVILEDEKLLRRYDSLSRMRGGDPK